MNSSENSIEDDDFSTENYKIKKQNVVKTMSLRQKRQKSYKEADDDDDDSNFDDFNEELENNIGTRLQNGKQLKSLKKNLVQTSMEEEYDDQQAEEQNRNQSKSLEDIESEEKEIMEIEDEQDVQEQPGGIFYPDIEVILWKRPSKNKPGTIEYLIKYKDFSYLHAEWLEEKDITLSGQYAKNKLNRFNRNFEKKIQEQFIEDYENVDNYFDPSYVEVDRILTCTEQFPIIHPKKANEIKGKWSDYLVTVVSKLLNFSKDTVHYGIHFMEPVNPEKDGIPHYRKIISQPMDLGTLLNRIYLDYFKKSSMFWIELGLVFKNCRKFHKDPNSDIRILGDTLREVAIYLYKQYHQLQSQRYKKLLEEFIEREQSMKEAIRVQEQLKEILIRMEVPQQKKIEGVQNGSQQNQQLEQQNQPLMQIINQIKDFILESPQIFNQNQYNDQLIKKALNNIDFENLLNIFLSKIDPSFNFDLLQFFQIQGQYIINAITSLCQNYQQQELQQQQQQQQEYSEQSQSRLVNNNQKLQQNSNNIQNLQIQDYQPQLKDQASDIWAGYDKVQIEQLAKNNLQKLRQLQQESSLSREEIEMYNPGEFNYAWLQDEKATTSVDQEEFNYIGQDEFNEIDLNKEVDKLYLVKWKNLSYLDSTWEKESVIGAPEKINDYRQFNRALDKESRNLMSQQVLRHKYLLEYKQNPRKYQGDKNQKKIMEIQQKLYHYNTKKKHFQYNAQNQPVYKDRRLLRDYQLQSLNWLISSWYENRNVILADEMGLGKTIQSMAFLNHLNTFENIRGPFLIIAPLSTLEHWKRTGDNWTNLNCILYYDTNSIEGRACCRNYEWFHTDISTKGSILQTNEIYKFHVLITSYEVFQQDLTSVFLNIPFQFIVLDEAHRLKNRNCKVLASLNKLACRRILLLTGTPIQNNTDELFSLLNFIEPETFSSLEQFQFKYGDLKTSEQVAKFVEDLKPYLLRRMKEDVEKSIPPLQETIIDVELTTVQKTIYRALYERNKSILSKGFSGNNSGSGEFKSSLNNLEMQLRKCCNHPFLIRDIEYDLTKDCISQSQRIQKMLDSSGKMLFLDKILTKMKNEGKKVLIFSQFTQMLVLIEEYLKFKQYKYEKIDGSIKNRERQNAIDRFNSPDQKRDVFLLSTKAGGLGINLTSANIVIIFDSDWNPQNDVQATARAHRIGQQQEVQVYRLITTRTYEAEMFERATKKLGLDQAIFLGGEFQNTSNGNDEKKLNKQEIELLLKRGILGVYEEQMGDQQTKSFMEDDIDKIIENSRNANINLIKGTFSFSKSKFISNNSDNTIDINDPNFWEQVLKNNETQSQKLLKDLNTDKLILTDYKIQKRFMIQLSEQVSQLVETKLNVLGYSADDEKNIMEIMQNISNNKSFNKIYRDIAIDWTYEIERPSRRFKKLTEQDFVITELENSNNNTETLTAQVQRSMRLKKTQNAKQQSQKQEDDVKNLESDDREQLFEFEGSEISKQDYDDISGSEQSALDGGDLPTIKRKTKSGPIKEMEERFRKICAYCERNKCSQFCQEYCRRSFHIQCQDAVDKDQQIPGLDTNNIYYDLPEHKLSDDKLKQQLNMDYICHDCQNKQAICFLCKQKGNIQQEKGANGKKRNNNNRTIDESNELTKCSTANCHKYYHLSCLQDQKLVTYVDRIKTRFRCPLHYCQKCLVSGDSMAIIQCFRCPTSFHAKCLQKQKTYKLSKKYILCSKHEFPIGKSNQIGNQNKESTRGNQKIPSEKYILQKGDDDNQFKIQQLQSNLLRTTRNSKQKGIQDYMISQKKQGILLDEEEIEKIENDKKLYDSLNIKRKIKDRDKEKKSESPSFKKEDKEEGQIIVKSKSNRDRQDKKKHEKHSSSSSFKKSTNFNSKKNTNENFNYEKLQLIPPEKYNFDDHQGDWCRYCGARFSSNFTKGPWGPRTLCTIHYIEWMQKKRLNLTPYEKDKPSKPINTADCTELGYLNNMNSKATDDLFDPLSVIDQKLLKKIKIIENDYKLQNINDDNAQKEQEEKNKIEIKQELQKLSNQNLNLESNSDRDTKDEYDNEKNNQVSENSLKDELEEGQV